MNEFNYMNDLSKLLSEVKNYLRRSDEQRVTASDNNIMLQLLTAYQETFDGYQEMVLPEGGNVTIVQIQSGVNDMKDALKTENNHKFIVAYEMLINIDKRNQMIAKRTETMSSIFQSDAAALQLHDTKIRTMQDLVNLDLKLYGKITEDTFEVLDVQHCTIDENSQVIEKQKETEQEISDKPASDNRENKEQSYQASAYVKGTVGKQKPTVLYGNSPEAIITVLQGWNKARTEDMKFTNCYIRKLNTETNSYDNPARYEVATGKDITPIYLSIPHMSKDKFTKTVAELKADGARYNPVKKAFYITKQDDLNKFADYIPISGTHVQEGENHGKTELSYEIENGQEYYDNRIKLTVEGMEPINIYGDDYDVHFPSMSAENTSEIIEKFVLPSIDLERKLKEVPKEITFNGRQYNPLQYEVLQLAMKQNFTKEQMQLLERPELSSDRMNEIRFAVRDGLSVEQISQFATPDHEQWQMDFCRLGMQHGFGYHELKDIINPEGYDKGKWGERRSQLAKMIKDKERSYDVEKRPYSTHLAHKKGQGNQSSVLSKLRQNEAVLKEEGDLTGKERKSPDITR